MSLGTGVVAAVFVPRLPENFIPTLRSLRAAHADMALMVGSPAVEVLRPLRDLADDVTHAASLAGLVNDVWARTGMHVLCVGDAVIAPPGFLNRASVALDSEMRLATISFLSNAAGHLSFPTRNSPQLRNPDGADETSITRRLRETLPEPTLAPVPIPGGAAVLISRTALGLVGPLAAFPSGSMASTIEDFSVRCRQRGLVDLVDTGTYCAHPSDIATTDLVAGAPVAERQAMLARHPYFGSFLATEQASTSSPMALAIDTARAKVTGLRVLIEAGCLGPLQTGTQVQTLALVKALAARGDVARVCVALATDVPGYAVEVLRLPRVEARLTIGHDFSGFGEVDVAHRPYQPDSRIDIARWRTVAKRTVVTIQDLIAYHVGAYHATEGVWLGYRDGVQSTVGLVDGVAVVSHDTLAQVVRECLPIEPARVFVAENGTDHLTGDEAAQLPAELVARHAVDRQFILVLGTNYAHKNRDVAIDAWKELRRRGWPHSLILAGAQVPYGSSRLSELNATADGSEVLTLSDVSAEERHWLLRHASLLLHPTSAEGFGLVPYEAARFGTPAVSIPFGPLAEVAPRTPVWSHDWRPVSIADAAEGLLSDPALAREQATATLDAGTTYTWERTASKLVEAYRCLLAQPARS